MAPLSPSASRYPAVTPGKALIALPIFLASFALLLQLTDKQTERTSLYLGGGFSEQEYLPQPRVHKVAEPAVRRLAAAQPAATKVQQLGLGEEWKPQQPDPTGTKIAFVVTTAEPLRQIKVWLSYHKAIGVSTFYIFADGQAARPDVMAELRSIEGVKVVPRDEKLKEAHTRSRIWNETWLSAFFHKPCNHELFVIQSLNMEIAIRMARADGIDWLLHIDTDELIYPSGSQAFSLQEVLAGTPADVDTLIFPNYESLPEREDVGDPFTEVTLFKKNYQHVVSDLYFKNYHTVARGNPNYFITYGNGKSAARVQRGLRPNGAHRWHSYVKTPNEQSSDQAAVLHYTYNRFGDLKSRRDRCDCAPTEEDAKRCFILPFDRMAFMEASLKSDNELMQWFRDRLVWGDPGVVTDLLKKGLFARLYEPQLMIRGFLATMDGQEAHLQQQAQQQALQQGQQLPLEGQPGNEAGEGRAAADAEATAAAGQAAEGAAAAAAAGGAQQGGDGAAGQGGTAGLGEQAVAADSSDVGSGTAAQLEEQRRKREQAAAEQQQQGQGQGQQGDQQQLTAVQQLAIKQQQILAMRQQAATQQQQQQ